MPTPPSYPGVYVEETSSGVRPLTAASTSTAAFVGLAEMGPEEATRVTNWTEFQRLYGTFMPDGFLAHSVFQYFNNGGRQCYVVRVTREEAETASVTLRNRAETPTSGVVFSAKSGGAWGNSLVLQIEDGTEDSGNTFKVSVRRQTDPAVVPADFNSILPRETFDNLSIDPASPRFVTNVLKAESHLITATVLDENVAVQRGLLRGGSAPDLPLETPLTFRIDLDGDGLQDVTLPDEGGPITTPERAATVVEQAVRRLERLKESTDDAAFDEFTCQVEENGDKTRLVLRSGTNSATSSVRVQSAGLDAAADKLKLSPAARGRPEDGLAPRRPARADVVQIGDAAVGGPVAAVAAGVDGTSQMGETAFANAFTRLDNITDFSLLSVPGIGTTAMMNLGMAYCTNRPLRDVFYVGETGKGDVTAEQAATFRRGLTAPSSYGALYFPWVKALDPTGQSQDAILLPPSGFISGLYARIDSSRGVWKAPAGTEASLNGVVGLATELSDVQHGELNLQGVDVIRRFPQAGVVAFGARTISSDPQWRYVPVRRTAIMLRVSIYYGIQWAVFEPNDESLWSQLRLSISSFMMTLYRQGSFQGSSAAQAFFVKCDGETTTQADIEAGVVNVLVGFAPLRPAEFIVVKISQKAGMASG
ncbi:phage tail sheath subtilisin-like domain-containing protein [Streptomyces sp. NBC_00638]|uniref:phage tail sheath C-terminal domain-containing protein n=1 Tax=unclassified Streptomyces TaxID=2593676 RepID=UPI0022581EAE|nr:phage tail sheath C-terminal domain-containing protein [Streptomyces sp. NBC_00638]MCX5001183.1 phage tail sheath subtilisin-like domain-containing protein [Streptomyces sp. NBC_00638]